MISFSDMLSQHIEVVDNLIRTVEEAQRKRDTARESHGSGVAGKAQVDEKNAAKQRTRKRFDPEKYERLCEKALREL